MFHEEKISDEAFFPRLDNDLFEKFLLHGEEYFDDPMMRRAYLQIQNVREAKQRAEVARRENEAFQANSAIQASQNSVES